MVNPSGSHLEHIFPELKDYKITSPATNNYNCLAWAAQDDSRWWEPDANYHYYWPPVVPREVSFTAYVAAYESLGYEPCGDGKPEDGFEKIAIYGSPTGKPTHAARLLQNGKWTSKLGGFEDIEHDLEELTLSDYGEPLVFLQRETSQ